MTFWIRMLLAAIGGFGAVAAWAHLSMPWDVAGTAAGIAVFFFAYSEYAKKKKYNHRMEWGTTLPLQLRRNKK